MKKILSLLLIFFTSTVSYALKEINVCYENNEQFPYYIGNDDNVPPENRGVSIDIITKALSEFNLEPNFIRTPWNRCLNLLKDGLVDLTFNSSFKESRKEFGRYPEKDNKVDPDRRIITLSYSLYVNKNSSLGWDGEKFTNLNGVIGTQRGFSINDKLSKMNVVIEEAANTEVNFKKLIHRRLIAVAAQTVTGDSIIENNEEYNNKISRLPIYLVEKPYYVMLSHQFVGKNIELSEKIWDEIAKVSKESMREFLKKYNTE